MRYIVINLSGILNNSLAESLGNHVDDILSDPSAIVLDFSKVSSIENSGLQLLKDVFEKIQATGEDRFALSSISSDFLNSLQKFVPFTLPAFESKTQAKGFLEKANATKQFEKIGIHTQYTQVSQFTQKGDIYYISCPGCSVKLRIRSIGNHACPSCKTRFFFKPEISGSGVAVTHYEMLALD